MAEKATEKTFAQFLEEQPAPAETVTLTGHAARGAKSGSFSFITGGQTMELPTDAVKRHKIVGEGPQKLVEIEVVVSKIDPRIVKFIVADGITNPLADHHKFSHTDPIADPVTLPESLMTEPAGFAQEPAAGAQPFVLATPHHAPPSTIAAQMGGPAARMLSMPLTDPATAWYFEGTYTLKEIPKDPVFDHYTVPEGVPDPASHSEMLRINTTPVSDLTTVAFLDQPHTAVWLDRQYTLKEVTKDPIADVYTLAENLPGGGGGTAAEGVAGGVPVVNPVWNLPGMMF